VSSSTTLTITECPCTITSSVELPAPTAAGNVSGIVSQPTVTASLFLGSGNALGHNTGVFEKLVAVALGIVAMI